METTLLITVVLFYYSILAYISELCVATERRYENDDE